jgi:hypothetical protein
MSDDGKADRFTAMMHTLAQLTDDQVAAVILAGKHDPAPKVSQFFWLLELELEKLRAKRNTP